ncbi:MAG: SIMPL domain-containing protein, partial [Cytophagales bacterium]|nr:SIMPL domain-containing protein [Armatimonadota bacterium]
MRTRFEKSVLAAAATMAGFGILTMTATTILPTSAHAQEATKESDSGMNGIIVSGTGEVQVKPDIARVTLGVQNQGREASGVSQENAQKTDALIKAVKAAGVADKDIQTAGYSLYPQYDYSNGIAPDGRPLPVTSPPKISGYQASNT